MYCMLKQGGVGHLFNDFHKLGLLIACLSHDLDHRGTNNAFQFKYVGKYIRICKLALSMRANNQLRVLTAFAV